jgi:hypothetical protein
MPMTFRCVTILALSEGKDSNLKILFHGYSLGDNPGLLTRTPLEMCAYTVPAGSLLYTLYIYIYIYIYTESRQKQEF